MRKILLGIISLLLIASVGYSEEQPLQLTIKSDKEAYEVGDEIIISGYFKNNSVDKVYVIKDDKPLLWCRLIVNNPDGIEFWYDAYSNKEFGPAPPNAYTAIPPKQSIEYFTFKAIAGKLSGHEYNWHYETTIVPENVSYPFVSKGTHKVKFLYISDFAPTIKEALKGKFTSNTIKIEIAEKRSGITEEKVIVTTDRLEYKHGDTLRYEVYNGFTKDIFIMKGQHNVNFIERQDTDGSWKRFGLTMLPEEPPPPGWEPYEKISSGEKKIYDRWLGWLFDVENNKQVDFVPGHYRLIVEYKFDKEDKKFQEVKSNEFKISTKDSFKNEQNLSPWTNKAPYPYENEDKLLVAESYKEMWIESSVEKHPEAVQRAKEVLREWGQNPDKYEYEGKTYDYKIHVSESPNFISVVFLPIGLEGLERHVEVRMTKKDLAVLSILPGA